MKVAHISLYPPRGAKHVEGSGVISYTKNLVSNIHQNAEQHMLTHRINGKTETYEEDGITVHRCFDRGPMFVWQLHKELRRLRPDVIHIQQEVSLFGGVASTYLLQYLVSAWRQRTVITMHHVVDPDIIDKNFVTQNNSSVPVPLVRLAFRMIYTPLVRHSRHIITHEPIFKDIIVHSYGADPGKVSVIPHGVEDLQAKPAIASRKALQLPQDAQLVLYMGYATGYKGLDLLIEGFAAYAKHQPRAFLAIGAGKHPKLLDNAAYLAKYQRWQDKAAQLIPQDQYRWVGFIGEAEIPTYYSAADVSVYPYTTTLSSSGPMSLAMGYEKPFLGSMVFRNIFSEYPQLLFDSNPGALAAKLEDFFANQQAYQGVSAQLKQQRIWKTVGDKTAQVYRGVEQLNEPAYTPATPALEDDTK